MKKTIKFTAAVAMIGLMAFASAGCGGDDKKAAAAKDTLKFGVTNFADSLEPTDNYFGWIVMRYGLGECLVKFDEKNEFYSVAGRKFGRSVTISLPGLLKSMIKQNFQTVTK